MIKPLIAIFTFGLFPLFSCTDENRGYPKSEKTHQRVNITDEREQIASAALQKLIKDNARGVLRFNNFRKTNGVENEFLGIQMYTLEWVATVETVREIWGRRNMIEFDFEDDLEFDLVKPDGWNMIPDAEKMYYLPNKILNLAGESSFEKTDNGWRLSLTSIEFTDPSDKMADANDDEMKIIIGK